MKNNKIYSSFFYCSFIIGMIINVFCIFKSDELKDYPNLLFWGAGFAATFIFTNIVRKSKYGWYTIALLSGYLFFVISKSIEPHYIEFNYNWNESFSNINKDFAPFFPLKYFVNLFPGISSFAIVINVLSWIISIIFIASYVSQPVTQRNRTYNGLFTLVCAHAIALLIFPITAPYINQNELYSGDSFNVANMALNKVAHSNQFIIGSLPVAIITYISAILFRQNIILGIFCFVFTFFVILSQIVLDYCYITDIVISIIASITCFIGIAGGLKKSEFI